MKKIKVLHIQITHSMGGIETFLLNLYKNIDREKFQFDFVTEYENLASRESFEGLGGNIFKISQIKNPLNYYSDLMNIIDKSYDIVHIHKNTAANLIPFYVASQKGINIVSHSHNSQTSKGVFIKALHKFNRSYIYSTADYCFACSDVAGEWLYGKNDFEVVKNGIETDRFLFNDNERHRLRESLGINDDAIVLGCVGRFVHQKNHKLLIEIFKEICEKENNAYLILVGVGELLNVIKDKVSEYQLEEKVLFLGTRFDIPNIMSAMDVFVMTSFYEGLPVVAVEAQASGLRMFISDTISEQSKLISDYDWFSIKSSPKEIANMFLSKCMIKNTKENRIICNRVVVDKGFDIRKTVNRIEDVYKMLLINRDINY